LGQLNHSLARAPDFLLHGIHRAYPKKKLMKKYPLLVACMMLLALSSFAQTSKEKISTAHIDSLKEAYWDDVALKYPIFRQGFLSTDIIGSGNTEAYLHGNPLFKGKINIVREQGNFNIPLTYWGKNSLVASVNFQNQHFDVNPTQVYNPQFPFKDMSIDKGIVGFALTYTRRDSLFNLPVVYNGTVAGFTDDYSSVKKINYQGTITFPFRHTANSSMSLGLAVIIDPSTPSPVLPVFYYWHKYDNNLELFIDIPTRISLRKQLSSNTWASFGTQMSGSFVFFNIDEPALPQNDTYSTFELKTGPTFEYLVSKKIVLGVSGGLFSTLTSKEFKQNTNPNDYFGKNNNSSVPYVNFTVSFLPFFRTNK
jgi:hypothetical protein